MLLNSALQSLSSLQSDVGSAQEAKTFESPRQSPKGLLVGFVAVPRGLQSNCAALSGCLRLLLV